MREQLKLLEELQHIDLQLQGFEDKLTALPTKLQSLKNDVQRVDQILEGDRQRLAETLAYKAELAGAVAQDRELLNKTKSKLASVRTSKEYMAIQREFETNRKLTAEREEEIAKLESAIQESQKGVDEKAQQVAELQSHVAEEAKETERKLGELDKEAEVLRKTRQERANVVQKGLLRKYDRIRRLRQGSAVVPAEGGVCTGCRMHLPPQLYNILQRNETIEQCPNCHRIVYYRQPEESEESAEAAEA